MFGLTLGGTYALVALGLNLQYGVARILNLAYGEMLIVAAFGGLLLFTQAGVAPLLAAAALVPLALLAGALLYRVAFVPLIQRAPNREGNSRATRWYTAARSPNGASPRMASNPVPVYSG